MSTGGRGSIVPVPDTSIVGHVQSGGDIDNCRYFAPELHQSEGRGVDEITATRESDVYGMGMVVYEASSPILYRLAWGLDLMFISQVLTGNIPYSGCSDIVASSEIRAGKFPQRSSEEIPSPIWVFLEKCWNKDPRERPSIVQVHDALSQFQLLPPSIEELPHTDSHYTVPISRALSEELMPGVAQSRIDKLAKVMQVVPVPLGFHHTPVLETRACASRVGGRRFC